MNGAARPADVPVNGIKGLSHGAVDRAMTVSRRGKAGQQERDWETEARFGQGAVHGADGWHCNLKRDCEWQQMVGVGGGGQAGH